MTLAISLPQKPHPRCGQAGDSSWDKECLTYPCNFRTLCWAWPLVGASGIMSE